MPSWRLCRALDISPTSSSRRPSTRRSPPFCLVYSEQMRLTLLLIVLAASISVAAQDGAAPPKLAEGIHRSLDELLDLYVRDGFVYYNAVKSDRSRLDQYVRTLDSATGVQQSKGSREEQIAFWVNAYNAFVLQTVVDAFPIRGRAKEYPAISIRQIPG